MRLVCAHMSGRQCGSGQRMSSGMGMTAAGLRPDAGQKTVRLLGSPRWDRWADTLIEVHIAEFPRVRH
eukprot:3253933-Alexandrium_andersonii.AAC.1